MKWMGLLLTLVIGWSGVAEAASGKKVVPRPDKDRRDGVVLYQVKPGLTGAERSALATAQAKYGLTVMRTLVAGKVAMAKARGPNLPSEEAICQALVDSGAVVFAEPDYLEAPSYVPNDPDYSLQYHHPLMNSPAAWDITTGSSNIIVAVCDTGVQSTHPDLVANLILPGYNTVDNTTNSEDFWGHGTSVAGCIAAVGNNGIGVAGFGYNVKILPIRISNNSSNATAFISDMAEAMRYAVDNGAKVVNLSYGGAYSATIDSAAQYVRSKGGLHFMSAGNENSDLSANSDWASFVIVGATDSSDNRASFSNFGTPVDVTAPGVSIRTTRRGSTYGYASGTSFSSPIVAGVGALIYSVNPNFTPSQVEQFLFTTAKDIGAVGEDSVFGHGRVDAGAAIAAAKGAVGNPSPVAVVSATPTSGNVPLTVNFSGAGSYDDGTITGYQWNFGNGATASGVNVAYTYTAAGTYSAVLTVTDNLGQNGTASVTITVSPDPFLLYAPSGLSATVSGNTVTLRWTDNAQVEDGFYIERGVKSKGVTTWSRVGQVGANITTFVQTVANGTYQYRVQAFSSTKGVSAYTPQIQVSVGATKGRK